MPGIGLTKLTVVGVESFLAAQLPQDQGDGSRNLVLCARQKRVFSGSRIAKSSCQNQATRPSAVNRAPCAPRISLGTPLVSNG